MPGTSSLLAFIAAALVILLIPGAGVLYVVTRSVAQGRRAGLISALGLSTGVLVHVGAATIGLSAILVASATAFAAVKFIGAAYLIYLGVQAIAKRKSAQIAAPVRRPYQRLFIDGIIVTALNPKVAVFFLAFLPQFVDPSRGAIASQLCMLGLIYIGLAMITDGTYAILAGTVAGFFAHHGKRRQRIAQRMAGTIYISLGIGTVFTGQRP